MQSTLLSFLGQKEVYPTVFYMKNYNIQFINKIPNESKFLGKIKWKYSSNDLSIFIDNKNHNTDIYKFNNDYTTNNISLLKSQLQKSIRRKLSDLYEHLEDRKNAADLKFDLFVESFDKALLEEYFLASYNL